MTTLYVDCEFNGFGGELMSMGIAASDGQEWYQVRAVPADPEPWVASNVVPVLDGSPVGDEAFRRRLHNWLSQYKKPHVVADWYTDLVHFFDCFRGENHAQTFAFPCTAEIRFCKYVSAVPHNALEDAKAIRAVLS